MRIEGIFESLRYLLGGDRPSQTTHLTLSSEYKLDDTYLKNGISLTIPP